MTRLFPLLALLALLAWMPGAGAQVTRTAALPNLAQTERSAVELKQGMTLDEVQQLLGKPRRTALRDAGSYPGQASTGTLQWTYSWTSGTSYASAERSLQIDFASRAPSDWHVKSWGWSN